MRRDLARQPKSSKKVREPRILAQAVELRLESQMNAISWARIE